MGTCSARSTGRGEQVKVGGPPHGQALVSEKSALEPPGLGQPELLPADGGHSGARGTLGPSPAQDWGFLGPGLEFPHAATPHPGLSQREPSQPAPVPAATVSAPPTGARRPSRPFLLAAPRGPGAAAGPLQRRRRSSGDPLRRPRARAAGGSRARALCPPGPCRRFSSRPGLGRSFCRPRVHTPAHTCSHTCAHAHALTTHAHPTRAHSTHTRVLRGGGCALGGAGISTCRSQRSPPLEQPFGCAVTETPADGQAGPQSAHGAAAGGRRSPAVGAGAGGSSGLLPRWAPSLCPGRGLWLHRRSLGGAGGTRWAPLSQRVPEAACRQTAGHGPWAETTALSSLGHRLSRHLGLWRGPCCSSAQACRGDGSRDTRTPQHPGPQPLAAQGQTGAGRGFTPCPPPQLLPTGLGWVPPGPRARARRRHPHTHVASRPAVPPSCPPPRASPTVTCSSALYLHFCFFIVVKYA